MKKQANLSFAIIPHLAGNQLNRHADCYGRVVYIGKLGGYYGDLIQFDEDKGVGCAPGYARISGTYVSRVFARACALMASICCWVR